MAKKHKCEDWEKKWVVDSTGYLKCVCGEKQEQESDGEPLPAPEPEPVVVNPVETPVPFDGSDYVPVRDDVRLSKQYVRVFELMKDGVWRTLQSIAEQTGDPAASVSAQLRHMRKPKFGAHTVNKHYKGDGLYIYQLVVRLVGEPEPDRNARKHCQTCTC